jgi:hypothetical protein
VIFKLKSCTFDEGLYNDTFNSDDLEEIPGNGFIENRQIKNFAEYKNFFVKITDGKDVEIESNEQLFIAFNYYYEIWDNWKQFKILPHGNGTLDELPWVLDLIKSFNNTYKEIELYYEKKRR